MTHSPNETFNANAIDDRDALPQWDLDDMFGYDGYGSDSFEADYSKAQAMSKDFIAQYKGKIKTLSGDELHQAIEADHDIDVLLSKLGTYVSLKQTQNVIAHSQNTQAFGTRTTEDFQAMDFFAEELKKLSAKHTNDLIKSSKALQEWAPVLESIQKNKKHSMKLDVQRFSQDQGAMGQIVGMFSRRQAALRFDFEGKKLNTAQISSIIQNDQDQNRRAAANAEFERVLNGDRWFNAEIHNALIKFKSASDKWSKFNTPQDARHLSNNVDASVVDALESAVKGAYDRTSHRFYALKARLMGQDKLNMYDRNVNIFEGSDEQRISWDEAKEIVLQAYYSFDKRAGEIAQKFFDNGWIDAVVTDNKAGGAFAHPGAAQSVNPLVMVNFQGKASDVKTLAHELGHGIHQYLAAEGGDRIKSTPLTLAETASVFGEMLTFKSLLAQAENDEQRRKLLFEKVGQMLNTVVRQIGFYDFEKRTHGQYKETKRPLSEDDFAKHWCDVAEESLGPSVKIEKEYGAVFGYIPHIVRTPFYVYAYAFGDSLVNALYGAYESKQMPDEEFKEKYFSMLQKGGLYTVDDLKTDFGLDVRDPNFWQLGLNVISGMIDELETLCEPKLKNIAALKKDALAPTTDIGTPEI